MENVVHVLVCCFLIYQNKSAKNVACHIFYWNDWKQPNENVHNIFWMSNFNESYFNILIQINLFCQKRRRISIYLVLKISNLDLTRSAFRFCSTKLNSNNIGISGVFWLNASIFFFCKNVQFGKILYRGSLKVVGAP